MMTVYQLKKLVEILDLKENSENTSLTPIRRDNYRKEYLMAKKLVMERIGEIDRAKKQARGGQCMDSRRSGRDNGGIKKETRRVGLPGSYSYL